MSTIFPWSNPIENKSKYISWKTYTDLGTECLWHLSMATWCTKQMHRCLFGLVPYVTLRVWSRSGGSYGNNTQVICLKRSLRDAPIGHQITSNIRIILSNKAIGYIVRQLKLTLYFASRFLRIFTIIKKLSIEYHHPPRTHTHIHTLTHTPHTHHSILHDFSTIVTTILIS